MKAQNQDPPGQRREYDADVVIVGLGPVGAMTANLLGQAGVKTLVLIVFAMPEVGSLNRATALYRDLVSQPTSSPPATPLTATVDGRAADCGPPELDD